MAHDSYCCEYFNSTRAFSTERIDEQFVGMIGQPGGSFDLLFEILEECPEKCRKAYHWLYC